MKADEATLMACPPPSAPDRRRSRASAASIRARGQLTVHEAADAISDLRELDPTRHAHEPLLDRIWGLRQNFSAYDAVYVALAEVPDASLVTCDRRLAHAPGMKKRAVLI
jgi:predicted nucleic acid-binding protein